MASNSRRVLFFALMLVVNEIRVSCEENNIPRIDRPHVNNNLQNKNVKGIVNDNSNLEFKPIVPQPQVDQGKEHIGNRAENGINRDNFNNMGGNKNTKIDEKLIYKPKKNNVHGLPPAGHGGARKSNFKLSETVQCAEEVRKHCNTKIYRNNFAIMDCLQSDVKIAEDMSKDCQHLIWVYKRNLTRDDRFEYAADEVCSAELKEIQECAQLPKGKGHVIPCLVDHIENITGNCRTYLSKMARIVFSDYRLIYNFVEECREDIEQFRCGRLQTADDEEKAKADTSVSKADTSVHNNRKHSVPNQATHSQGKTLECLSKKVANLKRECKRQLLRVAELQADDYHLDRPLFYSCRNDRERFCSKVAAGQGRIFECLFKHKFDADMSDECKEKLTVRQQMIAEDVKVEKTFFTACRTDIRMHRCFSVGHDTSGSGDDARRASVLLCLENLHKRDTPLTPECLGEMAELRRTLMEDYKINPEIMANCGTEISSCSGGLERGGKTIHCLMDIARNKKKKDNHAVQTMSPQCKRALESLVMEADVGGDYTMDKNLAQACQDVVNIACRHIAPGDSRVMNCLMDKLDSDHMTDECEEKLMEIQYFIVRDFRLDSSLYKHCHHDAHNLCHAPKDWVEQGNTNPELGPLILPCLFRHMKDHNADHELQVSRVCMHEIRRVMRHRAKRVELDPEIEKNCVADLGKFCSDGNNEKFTKGEEIACLQDNYDDLGDDCQEVVSNITEDQELFLELDNILMRSCLPMIKKFCEEEMDEDAEADDVIDCLIEHKHHSEMDDKCAAGVEHHQIISLKDFRFNHKFKEACKENVMTFCKSKKTKYDVVACLSEHVRNDTIKERKHRIVKPCRKQLRFEVLQRGEKIDLDPKLMEACKVDVKKICSHVEHENAKTIECLKNHPKKLSPKCRKVIFIRKKDDVVIGDYKLNQVCKKMIQQYCDTTDDSSVLHCLARNKGKPDFDGKCRNMVIRRLVIQNQDYRLNPILRKACKLDIPKFCKQITATEKNDEELEGKVITCLRKQFLIDRLSRECNSVVRDLIKESALNYLEDPALANACKTDIQDICAEHHNKAIQMQNQVVVHEDGKGKVIECLKQAFLQKAIKSEQCKKEIARVTEEAHIDINVDPLLHTACQQDLHRHCGHVNPGNGRQMNCILIELEDRPNGLTTECRNLITSRKDLWEYSVRVAPVEGLQEIYEQINISPAKTYILGVLCAIIGIIFIIGISCGRVTKRIAKGEKSR